MIAAPAIRPLAPPTINEPGPSPHEAKHAFWDALDNLRSASFALVDGEASSIIEPLTYAIEHIDEGVGLGFQDPPSQGVATIQRNATSAVWLAVELLQSRILDDGIRSAVADAIDEARPYVEELADSVADESDDDPAVA